MEYTIGTKVFRDWEIVDEIGEGSYGKVYQLRKENFGIVANGALKVIRIPRSQSDIKDALSQGMDEQSVTSYFKGVVDDLMREVAIMSDMKSHPNVVGCQDYDIVPHAGSLGWDILIRMDLLTPLQEYQTRSAMDEAQVRRLGIDLCEALVYCQNLGLIHRDIKPGNIFIDELGSFRLGDFGVARTADKTMGGMSKQGTENYMAPEVYLGREYGPTVDIYSLGMVLYQLMNANRLPFYPLPPAPIEFSHRFEVLKKRMSGVQMPPPCQASEEFAAIILKACSFESKDRYRTAADLLKALKENCSASDSTRNGFLEAGSRGVNGAADIGAFVPNGDETIGPACTFGTPTGDETIGPAFASFAGKGIAQSIPPFDCAADPIPEQPATPKTAAVPESVHTQPSAGGTARQGVSAAEKRAEHTSERKAPEKAAPVSTVPSKETTDKKKSKKGRLIAAVAAVAIVIGGVAVFNKMEQKQQEEQLQKTFERLMSEGEELMERDPSRAIWSYFEAKAIRPEDDAARLGYATALYRAGEHDEFISAFEQTLGQESDEIKGKVATMLADIYFERELYGAAWNYYEVAVDCGVSDLEVACCYVISLARDDNMEGAQEAYDQYVEPNWQYDKVDLIDYTKAELAYAVGDYEEAILNFECVLTNPDSELCRDALYYLAQACMDAARENNSAIPDAAYRAVDALTYYMEAYDLSNDSGLWRQLADAYELLCTQYPDQKEQYRGEKAKCIEKLIELEGPNQEFYKAVFSIYFLNGQYDEVERILQHYEDSCPEDYTPHAMRGYMLLQMENRLWASEECLWAAKEEFEIADRMIRDTDDRYFYDMLKEAIESDEKIMQSLQKEPAYTG